MASLRKSVAVSLLFTLFGGPGILLVLVPWWGTQFHLPLKTSRGRGAGMCGSYRGRAYRGGGWDADARCADRAPGGVRAVSLRSEPDVSGRPHGHRRGCTSAAKPNRGFGTRGCAGGHGVVCALL